MTAQRRLKKILIRVDGDQAGALVQFYTDGTLLVTHGGVEMGQGLHTKVAQIAASAFDIPLSSVSISETSTDKDDDDYSYDDDAVDVDVDDDVDDDDDDSDDEAIGFYLEAKKILTLEVKHYGQTLQFIKELVATTEKARVSECDHDQLLLLRAYHTIESVRYDLSRTSNAAVSLSVWHEDLTLMINNSRSQVENQLNVICNNVSYLTINVDCSQLLVGFKEACLRLPMLPSRILDPSLDYTAGTRMSSQSEMTTTEKKSKSCSGEAESEGSGGCKSPIDIPENHEAEDELYDAAYYQHYHHKCMEEEDEQYYPLVIREQRSLGDECCP